MSRVAHLSCRFCVLPDRDRIIDDDSSVASMLSLGPIVEGYTLVLPRQHHACVGEIPLGLRDAFLSQVHKVSQALELHYGKLIAFEHGRATCAAGAPATHCHHAHLHLVPTSVDLVELLSHQLETTQFSTAACDDGTSICKALGAFWDTMNVTLHPYLLAMSQSGACVHFIEEALRPQYLRYLLANAVGDVELANWVANPGHDMISAARLRLGLR
jgi:diadenosine tetraphosphate (Ap4A) HIT family hydrolase